MKKIKNYFPAIAAAIGLITCSKSLAMDISWNGFGSVYYAQAMNQHLRPYGLSDQRANFTTFSLMGLNLAAPIDEKFSFAAQFLALGDPIGSVDSFGLFVQWANLIYKPTDSTSLKFGRQLYSPLMASEFARVGFLLPFRQIPYVVHGTAPFTRFDGLSVAQTLEIGETKLILSLFGGEPLIDVDQNLLSAAGIAFSFGDLIGAQAELNGDGWRIRAHASRNYNEMKLSAPMPVTATYAGVAQNYSLGYRFDKFGFVSWGEYITTRIPDGPVTITGGKYIDHSEANYILAGYRVGRILPRYSFARGSHRFNLPGSATGEAVTHTLGVNFQASARVIIKAEYERDLIRVPGGGGYFVESTAGSQTKTGDGVFAGMDFIF